MIKFMLSVKDCYATLGLLRLPVLWRLGKFWRFCAYTFTFQTPKELATEDSNSPPRPQILSYHSHS